MQLEEITLALFAACNSLRVFAYVPQIYKAATDENGASAISRMTWSLFLMAHVSTIGYALVNRDDLWLALCFGGNALCCLAILGIAWWKGRQHPSLRADIVPIDYPETLEGRWRCSTGQKVNDEYRDFSRAALLQ
jgi:hypothetical protein